jgi:hypothetical protein
MCLFLAAGAGALGGLSTAMSVLGTVAGVVGQIQSYNAQAAYAEQQAKQAQKTLNLQVAQQRMEYNSEINKMQDEGADVAIEGYAAQSGLQASSAEAGIVGLSVDALRNEVIAKESRYGGKMAFNASMATDNARNALYMAERQQVANVRAIQMPEKPNFLAAAVDIGSSLVSGAQQGLKIQKNGYV